MNHWGQNFVNNGESPPVSNYYEGRNTDLSAQGGNYVNPDGIYHNVDYVGSGITYNHSYGHENSTDLNAWHGSQPKPEDHGTLYSFTPNENIYNKESKPDHYGTHYNYTANEVITPEMNNLKFEPEGRNYHQMEVEKINEYNTANNFNGVNNYYFNPNIENPQYMYPEHTNPNIENPDGQSFSANYYDQTSYNNPSHVPQVHYDGTNHHQIHNYYSSNETNTLSRFNHSYPNLPPQYSAPTYTQNYNPELLIYPEHSNPTTSIFNTESTELEPNTNFIPDINSAGSDFPHPLGSEVPMPQKKLDINKQNKNTSDPIKSNSNLLNSVGKCELCNSENPDIITKNKRKVCSICINNHFEQFLQDETKGQFKLFDHPIEAKIIKDHVLQESYLIYLKRGRLNEKKQTAYYNTRKNHTPTNCDFCGESHIGKFCIDFFYESISSPCLKCNQKSICFENECSDKICKNCVIGSVRKQIEKDPFLDPKCEFCKKGFSNFYLFKLFGGKENYQNFKRANAEDKYLSPDRECSICYLKHNLREMVTLYCNHNYCKSCIQGYFTSCLDSGDILNIRKCPQCPLNVEKTEASEYFAETEIDTYTILEHLDERQKKLFDTILLKGLKGDKNDENLYMKWCKKCDFGMFINLNENPEFDCPNCKSSFCVRCNTKHMRGLCPDFRKTIRSGQFSKLIEDQYLKNLMEDVNACPSCGEGVYKISGCNFMKCEWPKCDGTFFCSICSKKLDISQHFTHYKKSGPFGISCNMTDGIKDD